MGSKGPSGNTTTTTVNPTSQAQLPFLQQGWNQAGNLLSSNPISYYPGQTLADPGGNWATNQALTNQINYGAQLSWLAPSAVNSAGRAIDAQTSMLNGGPPDPSKAGYAALAAGGNPASNEAAFLQSLGYQIGGMPSNAASILTAQRDLANTANGAFLGANPYLAGEFNAAAMPVINAYQTATAPGTDSRFELAGRYGSGAHANATSQNEQNLGTTLGNLASNLYGQDYANERGLMTSAAGTLGGLGNATAQTGGNLAATGGNLAISGTAPELSALGGLQTGYQTQTGNTLKSLLLEPSIAGIPSAGMNSELGAANAYTGLQQSAINDAMARYYGNQMAPWQTLSTYLNSVGQPVLGSSSMTQPYFSNPVANALGLGTGALGLYNGLNTAGLLGSAAGLSEGAATGAGLFAGADSLGSMVPAAAAAGAWIVCTELVRQGRLPRRYWAVGARRFAEYPEVAKRGYYVWAIPSVQHLRRHPHSLYSRLLCNVFNWRAENIAAHRGIKGARKLKRGAAVTALLAIPCLALGVMCRERDWRQVYLSEETVQ